MIPDLFVYDTHLIEYYDIKTHNYPKLRFFPRGSNLHPIYSSLACRTKGQELHLASAA